MERTQNDIKTSVYFHSSISGNEYHESGGAASSGTAKGEPGGEGAGRGVWCPAFERLNRKLFVTEKGERLYDYAVHLLELSQEMEEDLLSSGNGGRIRLGSSITAGAFLVPERAARFQEHYPECRLEVSVQNSGKVIRQVLKNELDLGVIEDRAEEEMLVKIPFREDRLYFLCGASHPLAEKEPGITGRNLQFSPVSPGKRKRKPGDHRELSEKLPAVLSAPVGECEQ